MEATSPKKGVGVLIVAASLLVGTALASAQPESINKAENPDPAAPGPQARGSRTAEEVWDALGPDLKERGWDMAYVLDTFDHDHNRLLDPEEYRMLVVSLEIDEPDESATAMGAGTEAADSHISKGVPNVVSNPQEQSNPSLAEEGAPLHTGPTILDVAVDDLLGRPVVNLQNQRLGRISDVVVDPREGSIGLVVASGGFLGFGARKVVVDVSQLALTPDHRLLWETSRDESQLRELPEYRKEDYVDIAADSYSNLNMLREELTTARRE